MHALRRARTHTHTHTHTHARARTHTHTHTRNSVSGKHLRKGSNRVKTHFFMKISEYCPLQSIGLFRCNMKFRTERIYHKNCGVNKDALHSPDLIFQTEFTSPFAVGFINICAHVKDHVVHVRVRWIMKTLKHPVCTAGWVARLCRSQLFPGKATRIFHGTIPNGRIHLFGEKRKTNKQTNRRGLNVQ